MWDIAIEKVAEKEENTTDENIEEKNVIFVGSHDSVKLLEQSKKKFSL